MKRIENNQPYFDTEIAYSAQTVKHQPIIIEPEGLDCAYVAKNYDFSSEGEENKIDSFLVVLYNTSSREKCRLVKFQKTNTYWETFEYKHSDLTNFLGLPWDFVRENAMLDYEREENTRNPEPEEYIK